MSGVIKHDLVIIGGGPVGLFAGILAQSAGLDFVILEKNREPYKHSRSAGIHPPSLELFSREGLIDDFLKQGTRICRGHARTDGETLLGTLDFSDLETPFPFILTLPQWKTEQILETRLTGSDPDCLLRGITLTGMSPGEGRTLLDAETANGDPVTIESRLILACDGKNSTVRHLAGIPFTGKAYPHRYVMGDFPDNTGFSDDAVIFLARDGLAESFPLPGELRRWVVQQQKQQEYHISDFSGLSDAVWNRCGIRPDPEQCQMYSEFGVERFLAGIFWQDRVVLAGDAAHVVSPIGGQGMNLGWLNVYTAVSHIRNVLNGHSEIEMAAELYHRTARKRAWKVIHRSEWNMLLGNRKSVPAIRNCAIKLLLGGPFSRLLKTRFTMQGL